MLLGDSALETGDDYNDPGSGQEFAFTATTSGSATVAHVYLASVPSGTSLLVGVYDSAHARLGYCTIATPSANAWNFETSTVDIANNAMNIAMSSVSRSAYGMTHAS